MIDFGFDKIMLIGAVALIVIGPERLPKVARTVGHFIGKAQRYVADVKAEVNRSIELDELKQMKTRFEDAARDVHSAVHDELHQTSKDLNAAWRGDDAVMRGTAQAALGPDSGHHPGYAPMTSTYHPPRKNWRLKRSAMPQWYKQRHGVRGRAQSGAARVARFRPPSPGA